MPKKLALVVGLILLVVVIAVVALKDGRPPAVDPETPELADRLQLNRVALAATENLESAEAAKVWAELATQMPESSSVTLNAALNQLLLIDSLSETATNATSTPEEKTGARSQLPSVLAAARTAIESYQRTGGSSLVATWMNTRVQLREASLLPKSMTKSIRREQFDLLTKTINEASDDTDAPVILLAGPLIEVIELLEDPINGIPTDILQPAAVSLAKLSAMRPTNLFLAMRAAQIAITAEQPLASELVRRTQDLASAIEPILARQTEPIGKTPDQLIDEIVASIDENDFQSATSGMLIWFNLLNSTELIKTDRRRTSPHPLDLLSFESFRELSAIVAKANPIVASNKPLTYQTVELADSPDNQGKIVDVVSIDADLDLDEDVITLEQGDDSAIVRLVLNDATWSFAGELSLPGNWSELLVADLFVVDSSSPQRLRQDSSTDRHNTIRSLIVGGADGVRMVVVDGRVDAPENRLRVVEEVTGLESLRNVTTMATGDLEGDGDLDLMIAADGKIHALINRGNRTFFAVPDDAIVSDESLGDDPIVDMAIADLDRDLDLDVVAIHGDSGRVSWIENLLHLRFRHAALESVPALDGATSIAVEDLDGNVSWDLVVTSPTQSMAVYSQTAAAGQWRMESEQRVDQNGTITSDFDNDSFMETIGSASMVRWPGGETSPIQDWGLEAAVAIDFNNDRRIDLAGVETDGSLRIGLNQTEGAGEAVAVRFKGIDDNNANSGRVNHYAIGSVLELRFGPHIRSRIITDPVTHFGVDGVNAETDMRVIFPNGLTQAIAKVEPGTLIEEEQTLKGSCPYLYAFDGEKFQFVTDCLWAAPLGLQVAPGVVVPDRPWEHLLIDGKFIQPRNGAIELRMTEELWEVAYFDLLQLSAVDHPESVTVLTNEKVGPASIATPKVHSFANSDLRPVASARDTRGRDVTELLASVDRQHVRGFEHRFRQGLCEPHFIELDLSDRSEELADADEVHLVLTGWILPTDTSLNIQIDQNPELQSPQPPSLLVPDENEQGQWRVADPFIGFPGGKNKTIVIDISQSIRRDDPRVRIQTTAEILWDAALVSIRSDADAKQIASTVTVTPLECLSAEVTDHGFSRRIKPSANEAEVTVYEDADSSPRWPPLQGPLTAYGSVVDLLQTWDDKMVVIAGGDEIQLTFESIPPTGQTRDYILHGVGWDKDADLNTLEGQSSLPLPFREMKRYPAGLDQRERLEEVENINRSHLRREQDFRKFWRRSG